MIVFIFVIANDYNCVYFRTVLRERKGALVFQHQAPESTQRPLVLAGSAGKRKDGQMKSTPELLELSGRARVRAMFWPRQRAGLIEAGKVIGLSYPQLHRRIQQGKLTLRIRKDEFGQMFVTIDDLADYLFPSEDSESLPHQPAKKKVGHPRKSSEGGGQ